MDAVRRAATALAVTCFLAVLGVAVWISFRWENSVRPPPEQTKQKVFSRLVAEGFRYRDFENPGVDRFAFERCHVEKRRQGALTFGAFNVLVVDGLVLNLPARPVVAAGNVSAATAQTNSWLGAGLTETLLQSRGLGIGHVSGVRINGLTVNRCHTNRTERVLVAEKAESGMKAAALKLEGCDLYAPDGSVRRVRQAHLTVNPELVLIYRDGAAERRVEL